MPLCRKHFEERMHAHNLKRSRALAERNHAKDMTWELHCAIDNAMWTDPQSLLDVLDKVMHSIMLLYKEETSEKTIAAISTLGYWMHSLSLDHHLPLTHFEVHWQIKCLQRVLKEQRLNQLQALVDPSENFEFELFPSNLLDSETSSSQDSENSKMDMCGQEHPVTPTVN